MKKKYHVAIVGATGMVGRQFVSILEEFNFPVETLYAFASKRSANTYIPFKEQNILVEELTTESFDRPIDIAFFSAGSEISKTFGPQAASKGILVIDNSSQWRLDPQVPLIVPEVNFSDVYSHKYLIANPNCSTIQSMIPLQALKSFGITEVMYTTYQAVSGSGYRGVNDLQREEATPYQFYPKEIKGNVIPQIDVLLDNQFTKEEMKMREETRKILHLPTLPVSATCVRVPVLNGHSVSIAVTLSEEITRAHMLHALTQQPGLRLMEDQIPTPMESSGQDDILVGRIRQDLDNKYRWHLWVVADNIRKGAASNAVSIAQQYIKEEII